eukprot:TRINITY_DN4515_c0_g1_i2.p1 TRINITY_DN4515_c0_g1~~TRINITY_DN4515_c0_g1_i2.p1  ORF type:complete len:175 (-),score=22.01 TRINITY_DN4515_c0_g1_i2:210-734(-)
MMSSLSNFSGNRPLTQPFPQRVNKPLTLKRVNFQATSNPERNGQSDSEEAKEFVSGEWPVNWSLASIEDCAVFYQNKMYKEDISPHYILKDVMATDLYTTTPDAKVSSLDSIFEKVSGIPVIASPGSKALIGIITKTDRDNKKGDFVKDIMSTPPIALLQDADVSAAVSWWHAS